MSTAPPIMQPPLMPPPLPEAAPEQLLYNYLVRCKVLCLVAASLFLVGVGGGIVHYLEEGSVNFGALGFGIWYVLMAYGAAWLLHRRRSEGYLAALPCMLIMLLVIPVGTVFGILGFGWLNKARPLLRQG